MGAGSGQATYEWLEKIYPDVSVTGIVFTAIGIVTSDPASVDSVLAWAARLQNRRIGTTEQAYRVCQPCKV